MVPNKFCFSVLIQVCDLVMLNWATKVNIFLSLSLFNKHLSCSNSGAVRKIKCKLDLNIVLAILKVILL